MPKKRESGIFRIDEEGRPVAVYPEADPPTGSFERAHSHVEEAPSPKTRETDPSTLYGLAFRVFERYGVLALICGLLMYGFWKQNQQNREDARIAHVEFSKVYEAQTEAIKDMSAAQQTGNLELVKIGASLQNHLDEDHRHNH